MAPTHSSGVQSIQVEFWILTFIAPKVAIFAEKNSKIVSLISCKRSDLRKTLKYSQSRDLDGIHWILWIYREATPGFILHVIVITVLLRHLPVVLVRRWVCWRELCQLSSVLMIWCVCTTCQQCPVDAVLPGLLSNMHDTQPVHPSTASLLCDAASTFVFRLTALSCGYSSGLGKTRVSWVYYVLGFIAFFGLFCLNEQLGRLVVDSARQ